MLGTYLLFMRNLFRLTLGTKLTLIIAVILLVLLGLIMYFTSRNMGIITTETGEQRALEEVTVLNTRFSQIQAELVIASRLLASSSDLVQAAKNRNSARIEAIFTTESAALNFHDIDIVDQNGLRLLTIVEEGDTFDAGQEDALLEAALQGMTVSDLIVEQEGADGYEARLATAVPIYAAGNELIGGLLTSHKLDNDLLAELNFHRDNIQLLFVAEGHLLSQSWQVASAAEQDKLETAVLDPTLLTAAENGNVNVRSLSLTIDTTPYYFVSYTPVKLREAIKGAAIILVKQPEPFIFIQRLRLFFVAVMITTSILAMASMAFFVRRFITTPLSKLTTATQQMSGGNLQARADIHTDDEMGELGNSFNEMAARLERILNTLESRVAQRTADLSASNQQLQQEIGQRIQAEESLIRSRDMALEANRLKTELLANVSHELRTPLNGIMGFAEIMQERIPGPLTPKQAEMTGKIIESTLYLTTIVNDLLNQAQLEAGKMQLEMVPCNPALLVQEVREQLQPLAAAKGIKLTAVISPTIPPTVTTDPTRLRQVLMNLVSNGIKFTDEGRVEIEASGGENGRWVLKVHDTGIGIPPESHDHIFEPFRQVDGSATRRHQGTGLGLSIVRELVAMMGGRITLQSNVGQGSAFVIDLPITQPELYGARS